MSRNPNYQISNLDTDGYGRLVQVVNGQFYDGFGNLLDSFGNQVGTSGSNGNIS